MAEQIGHKHHKNQLPISKELRDGRIAFCKESKDGLLYAEIWADKDSVVPLKR